MAGKTAVVLGEKLRVTKTNFCGVPIEGAANQVVTEGFIRVNLSPEMKAREDLETTNAAGRVCVSTSIPAERKWHNVEVQLCDVDPDLWALIASWARVLDPDGNPIGFYDRARPETDFGVMFELWTGGESKDDCPVPTSDSVFSSPASGRNYGYFAFGGREFVNGDLTVEAQPSTFTFNGRTFAPKGWGRGPFNVANIANAGDAVEAGRLLVPIYRESDENHVMFMRTVIEPPEATDGAVPLDITGLFAGPPYYYDGPGQTAVDVAPEQAALDQAYVIAITGTPASGTFSLIAEYPDQADKETGTIVYNAAHGVVKTAVVTTLDDGYGASDWASSGGTLPGATVTIVPPPGVVLKKGDNNLGGGTDPDFTVTPV